MNNSIFYDGLEKDGEVKLLEKTSESIVKELSSVTDSTNFQRGLILDTETTGLDSQKDKIIEIGLREFYYDDDYNLVGLGKLYNGLQDPGFEIPTEITEITGLTSDNLKGQSIDWDIVNAFAESSNIILAHNAAFDFKFMKNCKTFTRNNILWGCSLSQVPWGELGFINKSLQVLALLHGFYYKAHRALIDVDAVALIISKSDYLKLIINANIPSIRVKAKGADFDSKELLKAQGYKWDGTEKYWWRDEPADKIEEIKSWLKKEVYIKGSFTRCQFEEIEIYERFL